MRNIRLLKSGEVSESAIHRCTIEWINHHPELRKIIFHIPNEGKRTGRYGAHLKALGLRPGVSDLFIAKGSHGFHGAWIEIKSREGTLSPAQRAFFEDMRAQNYFTAACYSFEEIINTIEWYCFNQKGMSSSNSSLTNPKSACVFS